MSKITDIQESLEALIASAFPEYFHLADAYDAPDNTNTRLEKGYATGFEGSANASEGFCEHGIRLKRSITVGLTNVYVANLSPSRRRDLERSLMDDQAKLLDLIYANYDLEGECQSIEFVTDDGIEYLSNDRKQFIVIFSKFIVDYRQGV